MQQATTPSGRNAGGGGLTPSRLCGGGGVSGGGGAGGSGGTGADSRPFELIKACVVAVTAEEKECLETGVLGACDISNANSSGPCAMTVATPTPMRGAGVTPLRGAGGGFVPGGVASGGLGGTGVGLGLGLCARVEEGLTTFLVLALGVLR